MPSKSHEVPTRLCWALPTSMALLFFFNLFLFFLGPYPRHMEVRRLGVESEPQLWAYTTATATQDPSCIFSLYHSSQQCQLNPLSKARDRTCVLMDTSQVHYCWAMMGNTLLFFSLRPHFKTFLFLECACTHVYMCPHALVPLHSSLPIWVTLPTLPVHQSLQRKHHFLHNIFGNVL